MYLISLLSNSLSQANTFSFDKVDTLDDVYIDQDVDNEFQVEQVNETNSYLAKVKTQPNLKYK